MDGPHGKLRGLYWDPVKNRYFPLANLDRLAKSAALAAKTLEAAAAATGAPTTGVPACARKRPRAGAPDETGAQSAAAKRMSRSLGRPRFANDLVSERLASSTLFGQEDLVDCSGESITSLKSYGTGGMCLTTDHGKVILVDAAGKARSLSVCSQQLLGLHCNVMRGSWVAVSNGNDPHIHAWRRDPSLPWNLGLEQQTLDFPSRDMFAMSSFDDITTIGSPKALRTVAYGNSLSMTTRKLPSDPFALHQISREIVYCGMRSQGISTEDLRTPARQPNILTTLPGGRSVVGIRRLKDSAVPWGLVASGLMNQMCIFDIRFASKPLRELSGHINTWYSPPSYNLALSFSPDDTVMMAGGSDFRLRAWSTVTGELLQPPTEHRRHALRMEFRHLVEHVDVCNDLSFRVASAGDLMRFVPYTVASKRSSR